MTKSTAITKRGEIGVAFGDELSTGDKIKIVRDYVIQNVEPYKEKILGLIEQSKSLIIKNDDDRKQVAAIVLDIKKEAADAKELRKKLLARAKKEIRSIEIPFSDLEKLQEQAEADFKTKLKQDYLDFETARLAAQDIHNTAAEKERAESGEFMPDVILAETERRIETELGYTTIRKDVKVTLVDKTAAISAIAGVHCNCPYCQKEIIIGPTLPNLVDMNETGYKKFFVSNNIKKAPGFKIEDDAIVVGVSKKEAE
jgi:vacuolar-type H+-ATPase subunit I/STV1